MTTPPLPLRSPFQWLTTPSVRKFFLIRIFLFPLVHGALLPALTLLPGLPVSKALTADLLYKFCSPAKAMKNWAEAGFMKLWVYEFLPVSALLTSLDEPCPATAAGAGMLWRQPHIATIHLLLCPGRQRLHKAHKTHSKTKKITIFH